MDRPTIHPEGTKPEGFSHMSEKISQNLRGVFGPTPHPVDLEGGGWQSPQKGMVAECMAGMRGKQCVTDIPGLRWKHCVGRGAGLRRARPGLVRAMRGTRAWYAKRAFAYGSDLGYVMDMSRAMVFGSNTGE